MSIIRHFFTRRIVIVLLLLLCAGFFWLATTSQLEVMFARNVLLYRIEKQWEAFMPTQPSGDMVAVEGSVNRAEGGNRFFAAVIESGATVVFADRIGRTVTAQTRGALYGLHVPADTYVPIATKVGYEDGGCFHWIGWCHSVSIQPDIRPNNVYFRLENASPRTQPADDSLRFFDDATTHAEVPQPMDVRRRGFTFIRAGQVLTASYVYEPLREGTYPMLLMVYPCSAYPCSTLNFDILSATMAAEGFVVVTFSPQRGLYLEDDIDDLIKLVAHIKAGQLSSKGNARKLGILTGSLTSIHVWRLAQLNHDMQAIVTLGGVSDIFLLRQRFEEGALHLEPKEIQDLVEYALIGLGRPNTNPEMYVRYSVAYHVDALPRIPIAIMHGEKDKIVPFEQTPHLSQALTAHNLPHETYVFPYEHYLQLSPPTPAELDMLDKVTSFLRRALQ